MDYLKKLKKAIEREGTTKDAAGKIDVSPAFLGDVINGKRRLSIPLAHKLQTKFGLEMWPMLMGQLKKEWTEYLNKIADKA